MVAAQEFGADLAAQPPTGGCEPSPLLRAQLLRKVALYKLLVRYPTLRIATLEHERTPDGRPTGHKLSVLYRLTADIDPTGQRISSLNAAAMTEMKTAGRFVRSADGELVPAHIPNLLIPAPRLPVCTPGANMETGSTVTLKPRCGTSSSGGTGGDRSGEVASRRSSKSPSNSIKHQVLAASAEVSPSTYGRGIVGKVVQGMTRHRHADSRQYIRTSIVEGTRQLLKKGFLCPETEPAIGGPKANELGNSVEVHTSASPAKPEVQAQSNPLLASRFPSKGGGVTTSGGAGDFESRIARAIHWLRQKKECDRSLFAARTKSAFPYPTSSQQGTRDPDSNNRLTFAHPEAAGGARKTFLSMLQQGLPDGPEAKPAEAARCIVNSFERTDFTAMIVERSGDSGSAGISSANRLQTEIQLRQAHSASPRAPLSHRKARGGITAASPEKGDCEYPNNLPAQPNPPDSSMSRFQSQRDSARLPHYAPDCLPNIAPTPTLLEAQFARDLARDCMGATSSVGCSGEPQTVAVPLGSCHDEGKKSMDCSGEFFARVIRWRTQTSMRNAACWLDWSSPADAPGAEHTSGLRRHSIITLHPRQESALLWTALPTTEARRLEHVNSTGWPEESLVASNKDAVNANSQNRVGIGRHTPSVGGLLHRHEAFHRTEFQVSPHALEARSTLSRQNNHDWQANKRQPVSPIDLGANEEKHDPRSRSSSTAAHRSNSVGALRERGLLTMKERVAFFEDKLSRHQALMEAEAQSLARLKLNSNQEEMLWPSRRGPLRLEAIYKIRLPLIVDESGTPWGRAPIIGPGKPENQNHAIAFSRMDTMQVMDMNMESYLEEAMKLRNLLQEFALNARMRILGEKNYENALSSKHLKRHAKLRQPVLASLLL